MASNDRGPAAFATTHWTGVLAARGESPEARRALGVLCEAYYAPVEAFIRHAWHGGDESRDLTQEFFTRLLAGHALDHVNRDCGRFRSYLLGAVKHFLADRCDRERAAKRGGAARLSSIDMLPPGDAGGDHSAGASSAPDPCDPNGFPPDAFFDRHWALALLARTLQALETEARERNECDRFETLKPWLTGDAASLTLEDAARRLDMSEGTAKVAIHRLRKRFRELIKAEIAATVAEADEVAAEMDYLIKALAFAGSVEYASRESKT